MNPIKDHEFAAYILGDAPAELRIRIEATAVADEDFAAELAVLSELGSTEGVEPLNVVISAKRRSWRGARRYALAAGILLAVAGTAWEGYELLRTPPFLHDTFGSRTISNVNWDPHFGRKGISAQDGYLRLINRGSVVSRREFGGPIEITLDWRWIDHAQWPLYAESFHVCLRTSGEHRKEHAFEIGDGVDVVFNAVVNNVSVWRADGREAALIQTSTPDSCPMPSGEWHRIRIIDNGDLVSIFVEGPSIDQRYKKEPILVARIPDDVTGKHLALFNREYVGGMNHESHVDNILIRPLKQ